MLKALFLSAVISHAPAMPELAKVGEAELRVLFWDVYKVTLSSDDGSYQQGQFPLQLTIDYWRDFSNKQLIDATRKEWRRLGICQDAPCEQWLTQLERMWPDIAKDERLSFVARHADRGHFYYNGRYLGALEGEGAAAQFLAIWLSPDSRYPKQRLALISQ